ncbi:hypothetical protein L208DRAFT_1408498 [Tricholoma matsutake]|nr:hypothetical protein L208DRAFT_1408498 [Tricholoma matsutake 945]
MNVIPNIIVHPTLFSLKGSLDEERLSSLTHLVANCVVKEKLVKDARTQLISTRTKLTMFFFN